MRAGRIALVGERSDAVVAHRAIPLALGLAGRALGTPLAWDWIPTDRIADAAGALGLYGGVWLVPGSPYASLAGALGAARFARESGTPLLGTCGGFQHLLIEVARSVAGLPDADHAETNPEAACPVIARLGRPLVEAEGAVRFAEGSLLAAAYGAPGATEGYHCSFGVNPAYRPALEAAGIRFTAFDNAGEIRGGEQPGHPFLAGVLFQPERAALRGAVPPLVQAFAAAALRS